MTREQIIAEARTWIGTKYAHHGRKRGISVDCVGVVIGVLGAFGISCNDTKKYNRYGLGPDQVMGEFPKYFDLIHPIHAKPGDIVGFRVLHPDIVQHVGFLTPIGILHTNDRIGKVVETCLDRRLRAMIIQAFRFRGIEE